MKLYRATNPDGTEIEAEKTGFMQVLATGQPVSGRQIRHVKLDCTVVDILSNTAPLFDIRGNMIAAVSVFQDITQLKQIERIKDDFYIDRQP